MAIRKTEGIVLQSRKFQETDKIITLISPNSPKQDYIVKGIQSSKSRSILATELGSYISLEFYEKDSEFPFYTKSIHLEERFEEIKKTYLGVSAVSYLLELSDLFLPPGEALPDLWKLLKGSLDAWNESGFSYLIVPFFKVRILQQAGVLPKIGECSRCHKPYSDLTGANLHLQGLEIVCKDCLPSGENQIQLLRIMEMIGRTKFSQLRDFAGFQIESGPIDFICNSLIRGFLGKKPRSEESFYLAYSEA